MERLRELPLKPVLLRPIYRGRTRPDGFDKEETHVLQLMRRRLQGEQREGGFTLIELMVVVLIIAILIAIAIPTFLGARQRAQDRAAQSNLRNALTAEKTYYTDNQQYSQDVAAGGALKSIENSLDWRANAAPAVNGAVYVLASGSANDVVTLGAHSASGTCFYLKDTSTGASAGTTYAKGTCTALDAIAAAFGASW
jgi:type IV pilus assembly protein PilA